jgi:hypothetical protein
MRLKLGIFFLGILLLFACQRGRVRIQPEETYPSKPSSTESSPAKPSPVETPPSAELPQAPKSALPTEPLPAKTYAEMVSRWKSYQDLVKWMEKDFSFDGERFRKFERQLPPPRTPEETFRVRSGIYIDAAIFARESLKRINPSYKAQMVVIIMRPYGYNHYVCSFMKDGKIFIMDYGTPYAALTGVHGPFNSLDEYKRFYQKNSPTNRRIEAVVYLK